MKGLEFVVRALKMTQNDEYYWKWCIIGLHNTIQAFIVCAISGTSGTGALKKQSAIKVLNYNGEFFKAELDYFLNLYEKMKKELKFPSTEGIDRSVDRLNKYRNQFIHFKPQGWSLEIAGLPKISKDCISIVEFLGWKPGHIHWYEQNIKKQIIGFHSEVLELLDRLGKTDLSTK